MRGKSSLARWISCRHTVTVTTPSLSAFALGVAAARTYTVNTSASPVSGGTVTGGGTFPSSASVTLVATASAGYVFTNWTEGAAAVSSSPSYTFSAEANRTLVANFVSAGGDVIITTSSLPANGGSTCGDGAYAARNQRDRDCDSKCGLQVFQVAGRVACR